MCAFIYVRNFFFTCSGSLISLTISRTLLQRSLKESHFKERRTIGKYLEITWHMRHKWNFSSVKTINTGEGLKLSINDTIQCARRIPSKIWISLMRFTDGTESKIRCVIPHTASVALSTRGLWDKRGIFSVWLLFLWQTCALFQKTNGFWIRLILFNGSHIKADVKFEFDMMILFDLWNPAVPVLHQIQNRLSIRKSLSIYILF